MGVFSLFFVSPGVAARLRRIVPALWRPLLLLGFPALAAAHEMTVFMSPTCLCCTKWAKHMRSGGFSGHVVSQQHMGPVKERIGVPAALRSCHTAVVGGYVIEGHVPADAVSRLLQERPAVAGLAVPGMPAGAPGMESPRPERYRILSFDRGGANTVFELR